MKKIALLLTSVLVFTMIFALSAPSFAEDGEAAVLGAAEGDELEGVVVDYNETAKEVPEDNSTSSKAIAAAILVAAAAAAGAIAMAIAISRATGAMARQPEMAGRINSAMMLGLVFIETAIIYALIVAILIIFVL